MKGFLAAVPFLAASASAHTTFQALWVNGASTGLKEAGAVRHDWTQGESNFPLKDVTVPEIACNKWATKAAGKKVTIAAGAKVSAEWHHEPTLRSGDGDEPIAASHKGPVLAYLGKVDDSASASPAGVKWFKIFEDGKDASGKWGVDRFIANKGMIDFSIPSCVAAGDYFLRVEVIGLHEADRANGAQLYPECAQISITGGGNAAPPTVSFPGAYEQNGQGLSYNLYSGNAAYKAPGPEVFTCGAGGSSPAPAPSSSAPAPSSSAPAPSTSAPAPTTAAPVPTTSAQVPAPQPTTMSTRTTRTRSGRPSASTRPSQPSSYPTTSVAAPAPSGTTPVGGTGSGASKAEIESFFTEIMALYEQWKAGA